tara:strand:- start:223 stop:1179 length:957 start_codon:yes stop_codon:yes gene_type:complete
MDPFTIALATFGIQKLRGKSTKRSLRDAAIAGGIGQFAGMAGFGSTMGPSMGSFAPTAFGQSAANKIAGDTLMQQLGNTAVGGGIERLIGQPEQTKSLEAALETAGNDPAKIKAAQELYGGSGFRSFSPGAQLGLTAAGTTLLAGDDEVDVPEGTRPEDYAKAKEKADKQLANLLDTYDYEGEAAGVSPYSYQQGNSLFTFNKGGIAEVRKFNQGGINYLPSKTDHDEKDVNNYVRAMGYVEDGSGNGDKDEDTMLAQLADGEFVSRADAILGAGIMEGADPKSFKDMRKKGAAFFYGQQAKFKRIFDLLDEARKETN